MILVGIFSRDDPSCYQWLIDKVLACGNVRDVRTVTITNSFQTFREETLKCDFAILYHSKNRGRINVTNVNDSLYDEELQYLSFVYDRKHVLVVIDDLDSSSEDEKSRILAHQPRIREFAQDLFIFSSADKASLNAGGYQTSTGAQRALDDMKRTVEASKKRVVHTGNPPPGRKQDQPTPTKREGTEWLALFLPTIAIHSLLETRPSTLTFIGVITVFVIIFIVVLIVLSVYNTHVPGTTTPVQTTVTPSNIIQSSIRTNTGLFNSTVK